MKKKLRRILLGCLALGMSTFLYGIELLISPTGFYIDLDRNSTQEIIVENPGTDKVRAEIGFEKPEDTKSDSYMGEWIKVYPKILNLKPGESKKVRFTVKKPKDISEGEYKTMIIFDEKKPQIQKQQIVKNGEIFDTEVLVNLRIGIEAYGKVGKRISTAKLHNLTFKKNKEKAKLSLDLSATGNAFPLIFHRTEFLDRNNKVIGIKEERIERYPKQQRNIFEKDIQDIPTDAVKAKVTIKEKESEEILAVKEFNF